MRKNNVARRWLYLCYIITPQAAQRIELGSKVDIGRVGDGAKKVKKASIVDKNKKPLRKSFSGLRYTTPIRGEV